MRSTYNMYDLYTYIYIYIYSKYSTYVVTRIYLSIYDIYVYIYIYIYIKIYILYYTDLIFLLCGYWVQKPFGITCQRKKWLTTPFLGSDESHSMELDWNELILGVNWCKTV